MGKFEVMEYNPGFLGRGKSKAAGNAPLQEDGVKAKIQVCI
jgi:hypothetical protein